MGGYSRAVKIVPVFGISWDTGIKPEILIGVSVNTFTVRGIGTRMFTGTNSGCSLLYGFRAHPLETDRAVFSAGDYATGEKHDKISVYKLYGGASHVR